MVPGSQTPVATGSCVYGMHPVARSQPCCRTTTARSCGSRSIPRRPGSPRPGAGGARVRTIEHPALVRTLAFAAAGHALVTGSADGTLFVIRDDREPVALPSPVGAITAVAFTSDGHVIAASAADHRIRIYDVVRG